jgi:hypothetical protein
MKTKTYDLNLYVIDGELRVLAHELMISSDGDIQTGTNFQVAYTMPVFRRNKPLWSAILEFFGESELYSELDSWYGVGLEARDLPNYDYTIDDLNKMPIELALAVTDLPEYKLVDYS